MEIPEDASKDARLAAREARLSAREARLGAREARMGERAIPQPPQNGEGIKPLRNARHEAFARHMSGGESQTQAYKMAGYAEISADANATRLMGNDGISARIEYLKIRAADQAIMSRSRALVRLSELAERSEDPNAIAAIRELAKMEAWNKELTGINMQISPVKLCFVEANEKDYQKVIETETTEPKEENGS